MDDNCELELEKIKLGHKRLVTIFQAVMALCVGLFALSIRDPNNSSAILSPNNALIAGYVLLLFNFFFGAKMILKKENEIDFLTKTIKPKESEDKTDFASNILFYIAVLMLLMVFLTVIKIITY